MNNREFEDSLQTQPKRFSASGAMKIKLAISSVFVALLLFGAGTIDASPISLGAASRFAALALNGPVLLNGGGANLGSTGPIGIAASGFTASWNAPAFTSQAYIHSGSILSGTFTGAQVIGGGANTTADTLLNSAVIDANSAATKAATSTPTSTFATNPGTITAGTTGNFVYNIGTFASGGTLTVSAPAGSTVIVNILATDLGIVSMKLNIAGGLTAEDVIWNIEPAITLNQGGGNNITGILLANTSSVIIAGGATVTGQVIASSISVTGSGLIVSTAPVVPEASSLSVVAIGGVAALLGHRFFRRRRSPG